jgi:hypothetical protein
MTLASLSEAPTIDNAGSVSRPPAVPSRGFAELAIWSVEVAPGAHSEPHTVSREEVFGLRSGRVSVEVGDKVHEPAPADAIIVPPDTPLRRGRSWQRKGIADRVHVTGGYRVTGDTGPCELRDDLAAMGTIVRRGRGR